MKAGIFNWSVHVCCVACMHAHVPDLLVHMLAWLPKPLCSTTIIVTKICQVSRGHATGEQTSQVHESAIDCH
jgi:hypothetical protein